MLGPNPFNSMWESAEYRERYEEIFSILTKFRSENEAPVDNFGCAQLFDTHETQDVQAYQLLVALLLSVQTKDEIVASTMQRLKEHGLNIESINNTSEEDMLELLSIVNFRTKKVKYIL